MYREVLALCIHRRRPDFEVLLASPESLDGEADRFKPHVLVEDADGAGVLLRWPDDVLCRIRLLKTERIEATVELDGTTSEVSDVSLEELLGVLEEARRLSLEDGE